MSKRAVIYARVSTDEQAEVGYGLPYQISKCEEYAERRGYRISTTIMDDYTGKTAFRPGMNELLEFIERQPVDSVLIHRTDRLGRRASVQDILESEIEARGAHVEYVAASFDRTTAVGRAMRRVQGAFDQLDYENIIDRLKEHKREAARRGSITTNRPPYGYSLFREKDATGKPITRLSIDEDEARIVRLIFDWYVNGDETGQTMTLHKIAARLTVMEVPRRSVSKPHFANGRNAARLGVWSHNTVASILTNETYTGTWHFGKTKSVPIPGTDQVRQVATERDTWISVPVPQVVSGAMFDAAQHRADKNKLEAKRNRKNEYMLVGRLRCATCGYSYSGQTIGQKAYYFCNGNYHTAVKMCSQPYFREAYLEPAIWRWITEIVTSPEYVDRVIEEQQASVEERNNHIHRLIATTERTIEQKKQDQANLIRLYARTPIDALEENIARLEAEMEEHRRDLADLTDRLEAVSFTPEYIADVKTLCARIRVGLQHFTPAERRETYQLLDVTAKLALEDGQRVAYASCVLAPEQERLSIVSTLSLSRVPIQRA